MEGGGRRCREVEEGGGRGNDMIGRNGTPDVNISLPRA